MRSDSKLLMFRSKTFFEVGKNCILNQSKFFLPAPDREEVSRFGETSLGSEMSDDLEFLKCIPPGVPLTKERFVLNGLTLLERKKRKKKRKISFYAK